jgi:hypothetical protein
MYYVCVDYFDAIFIYSFCWDLFCNVLTKNKETTDDSRLIKEEKYS